MEGKIVVEGKEIATFKCSEDGFSVECSEEGKKLCKEFCGCCK